jgi:membrane protease YdiL (CAAX protease family)
MIVTAGMAGDAGLRKLIRPLGCWRVAWYWYLLIAAYPIILHLAAAGIGVALGARAPIFFDSTNTGLPPGNPLVTGMVVFVATFVLTGLAEEIGWRGFALPMLQGRFSPLVASLILGALWAPWHYNPLNFPAIRSVLPWHIASVFAMTILLTFLYNSTRGNLWMCVLFHTSANWAAWLLPTSPIGGVDVRIAAAQTVLQLAVAVAVVLFFGVRRLAVRGAQPVTWR